MFAQAASATAAPNSTNSACTSPSSSGDHQRDLQTRGTFCAETATRAEPSKQATCAASLNEIEDQVASALKAGGLNSVRWRERLRQGGNLSKIKSGARIEKRSFRHLSAFCDSAGGV
mmetsp:Transcript_14402/g.35981  ORF Transcript_14402/g.35981 Transcript_14402/m.35981 type:complete len:117 (+) Transcript_14402:2608-2958(+)